MINTAKCPKCEKVITGVTTEDITMNVTFQPQWKGFTYSCPSCRTILGVEINPLAVKEDIVNALFERLRK
jgi:hypothetical protein